MFQMKKKMTRNKGDFIVFCCRSFFYSIFALSSAVYLGICLMKHKLILINTLFLYYFNDDIFLPPQS